MYRLHEAAKPRGTGDGPLGRWNPRFQVWPKPEPLSSALVVWNANDAWVGTQFVANRHPCLVATGPVNL
jgi:hypothetical protein